MPENQFTLSHDDGSFFRTGDSFGVRFERILDHPAPIVWKALTDPDQLSRWLAPATLDNDSITLQLTGGTMGGKIINWEEDRLLEYEWYKGSVVRWELLSEGPRRCRLVFTHSNVIEAQLQGAATGWHYHMDVLGLILDNQAPPKDAPKHWEEISRDAAARYMKTLRRFTQPVNF